MKRLHQLVDRPLEWTQPSARKEEFALHEGDELVGTLHFRSSFGSLAVATTGDGEWTFKRLGFFKTRVTVRAAGSDEDLGCFRDRTWGNGGTLEMRDGRRFRASNNLWMTKFNFATEAETALVRFENIGGVFRHHAKMEVLPALLQEGAPVWLPVFGWYLRLMMGRDAAAAA